jgi:hypothetical protein
MAKTNYQLTNDVKTGPYQYAFNTEMSMFEYMNANQPLGLQFNHHMGGYRQGRPSWMDANFYPVNERLVGGLDTSDDAVLLVDIGGSLGHDIEEFRYVDHQALMQLPADETHRSKFPDVPGRLVLQDLPVVIDAIKELPSKIERMKHDFHTEQPVKGGFNLEFFVKLTK